MFKNFLKNFLRYFLIIFTIGIINIIIVRANEWSLLLLIPIIFGISLIVSIILVPLQPTNIGNLSKKELDANLENTAEDFFSRLSDKENESIGKIIKYVQDHGGGETYLEMDENQKMRLRTMTKEHNVEVAVDLGTIELPNPKYEIESPDWKLEMEKIFDNLSNKLKTALGENYK